MKNKLDDSLIVEIIRNANESATSTFILDTQIEIAELNRSSIAIIILSIISLISKIVMKNFIQQCQGNRKSQLNALLHFNQGLTTAKFINWGMIIMLFLANFKQRTLVPHKAHLFQIFSNYITVIMILIQQMCTVEQKASNTWDILILVSWIMVLYCLLEVKKSMNEIFYFRMKGDLPKTTNNQIKSVLSVLGTTAFGVQCARQLVKFSLFIDEIQFHDDSIMLILLTQIICSIIYLIITQRGTKFLSFKNMIITELGFVLAYFICMFE